MIVISIIYHYILDNFVFFGALVASIKWIYEYTQSRKFERNKFLFERIEKIDELNNTKIVKKMLDWNKISIVDNNNRYLIDDDILIESLITHDKRDKFNDTEVWIRSQFDEYFDNLNELILLAECGLIDEYSLRKMMKYWIDILNGKKKVKSKQFSVQIQNYLIFYDYHDVASFIMKS